MHSPTRPSAENHAAPLRLVCWTAILVRSASHGVMRFVLMFSLLGCWTGPPHVSRPTSPSPKRARFVDYPLGLGACKWISIGEASEIIGQQLQYLDPGDNPYTCVLV